MGSLFLGGGILPVQHISHHQGNVLVGRVVQRADRSAEIHALHLAIDVRERHEIAFDGLGDCQHSVEAVGLRVTLYGNETDLEIKGVRKRLMRSASPRSSEGFGGRVE